MIKTGIYSITNKLNGKVYIGQSIHIKRRWTQHQNQGNWDLTLPLYRAFAKYGIENFDFSIIEECLVEELDNREIFYINYFDSLNPKFGYNLSSGGSSGGHFANLDYNKLELITTLLQESSKTQNEIADLVGVSYQTISTINTGASWKRDNLDYPIRKNSKKIQKKQKKQEKSVKETKVKRKYCTNCGIEVSTSNRTGLCISCSQKKRFGGIDRPEPIELARMICETSFVQVGKDFGVSDNAIKKWCKSYGIPHLKKELKQWYETNK